MDTLQIILVISLVAMAAINGASLLWAFYLDRKLRGRPVPKHYEVHVEGTKVFPEMDMNRVETEAEGQLTQAVATAADQLQAALADKATQMAAQIEATTTKELENYHINLQTLNQQSAKVFEQLQVELQQRRAQLMKQMDEEVQAEREKRMDAFNARLNDIVASYLTESLGSQVDLGAEATYIFEVLATHKEDIKRDVLS